MSDLEPIDPKLRALLSLERDAYAEDSFARDAVLRRIQAAVVLAPLAMSALGAGAGASAGASAGAAGAHAAGTKAAVAASVGWKGAALVALVAFGGGVTVGEVHHASSSSSHLLAAPTSPTAAIAASSSPVAVVATTPDDLPSAASAIASSPRAAPSPIPSAGPALPPTSRAPAGGPNEERALVDTARTALARGRAADALVATEDHAKRFPRGQLAEEREALAIQAMAVAGDRAGASVRAGRFRTAYPNSIFGAAVDRAVRPYEGDPDAHR